MGQAASVGTKKQSEFRVENQECGEILTSIWQREAGVEQCLVGGTVPMLGFDPKHQPFLPSSHRRVSPSVFPQSIDEPDCSICNFVFLNCLFADTNNNIKHLATESPGSAKLYRMLILQ